METEKARRAAGRVLLAPFVILANVAHGMLRPIWWTLPLVVALISIAIPHLNAVMFTHWVATPLLGEHTISLPTELNLESPYLWAGMFAQVVPLGIWLIANVVQVTNKSTETSALQWDHFISVNVYGLMMVILGILFSAQLLYWGYLVPLVTVSLDAWLTGHFGLNNAAQKPGFGTHEDK